MILLNIALASVWFTAIFCAIKGMLASSHAETLFFMLIACGLAALGRILA